MFYKKHAHRIVGTIIMIMSLAQCNGLLAADAYDTNQSVTVVSYYFGNYHPNDARNTKQKGKGWSEWQLVKDAKPRFVGHQQPHVPLWGYQDESDPVVMANKINTASEYGVNAFIFDWYYYNDGPFLDSPVDTGFLKATNNLKLKFAFMWANHDWTDIHPYKRGTPQRVLYPGHVTPEVFSNICDLLIKNYFHHPSYWCIDGKPYFSIYDLEKFIGNFGSVQATREALDEFRKKAKASGLPGLHLNAVIWGQTILPGETKVADPAKLVKELGFDSITSYVWIHHTRLDGLTTDYNWVRDRYFDYWSKAEGEYSIPYIPNVTKGWDPSPRADLRDTYGNYGYPFTTIITNNTPANFRIALEMAKQRLLQQTNGLKILNINCWNEWTEGSYLEPDTVHGMAYLEEIKDVFRTPSNEVSLKLHASPDTQPDAHAVAN